MAEPAPPPMPLLLLALAATLAAAAHAQADTTAARRWLPLDVGNVWDYYTPVSHWGDPAVEWRLSVASDTLVGGVRWARLTEREITDGVLGPVSASALARFDGDVLVFADGPLSRTPILSLCSFAPGTLPEQECTLATAPPVPCPTSLSASVTAAVEIGGETVTALTRGSDTQGCEVAALYAADIGFLGYATLGSATTLEYVRTASVEAGAPLVVATEDAPGAPAAVVRLAPNPASGGVTVEASGAVSVEVFDALGRRAATAVRAGADTWRVEAGRLPAGAYVVRAAGPAGTATAPLTVGR